jgi:hypothetical protein
LLVSHHGWTTFVAIELLRITSVPSGKTILKFIGELSMPGVGIFATQQHSDEHIHQHSHDERNNHLHSVERSHLHHSDECNYLHSHKIYSGDLLFKALMYELFGMRLPIRLVSRPIRLDCWPCNDRAHQPSNDHNSNLHLPSDKEHQVFLV